MTPPSASSKEAEHSHVLSCLQLAAMAAGSEAEEHSLRMLLEAVSAREADNEEDDKDDDDDESCQGQLHLHVLPPHLRPKLAASLLKSLSLCMQS